MNVQRHRFEEEGRLWIPKQKPSDEPKDETKPAEAGGSQATAKGKEAGENDL